MKLLRHSKVDKAIGYATIGIAILNQCVFYCVNNLMLAENGSNLPYKRRIRKYTKRT
jgi:hypothetical protein